VLCFILITLRAKDNSKKWNSDMADSNKANSITSRKITQMVHQQATDDTNGSRSLSTSVNERSLVDAGVIQIVLAVTAIAFAIRQFIIASDTTLKFVAGGVWIVPIVSLDVLASWVFLISGVVSTLLFSVYLWEWVDRNFSAQAITTPSDLLLRLTALLAYGLFLILIFVTTVSQVMVLP
jgi:hypothetical protein